MARARRSDGERQWYSGKWTWVECQLDKSEKAKFEVWASDAKKVAKAQGVMSEGYQMQVSWDTRSKAYLCVLRYPFEDHADTGLCVSTRAPDLYEAVLLSLYKFTVVLGGKMTDHTDSGSAAWG